MKKPLSFPSFGATFLQMHSKSFILFLSLSFSINLAQAASPCFDFSKPSTKILHEPPTEFKANLDPSSFATHPTTHDDWGQVSGIVNKPILSLFQKLQDPKTIRNGDNTKVDIEAIESKDFLKRIDQKIRIKPVFFLTIEWKEAWAFALQGGTTENPEGIVVSYEKTEGTSHIKHLCGNILLKSLSPTTTGVYIYEEVQADRRNAKDVVNGLIGTLRTLRE